MSSSATPVSSASSEAFAPEEIWQWLEELREVVTNSSSAELLDLDGVSALDAAVSPLYVAVLNSLRTNKQHPKALRGLVERLRTAAYNWKLAAHERMAIRPSGPPAPVDVVFWPCDITHVHALWPVEQALHARGISTRTMTCRYKILEPLRRHGNDVLYTLGAWPSVVRRGRREGHFRARRMMSTRPWKLRDLGGRSGHELDAVVRHTLAVVLPLIAETIGNTRKMLERVNPRVLVVGNDLTVEGRVGARVAAAHGVPSVVAMHGAISGDGLQSFHCADRILLYGDVHRQQLLRQGVDDERLAVVGAPHLDTLPRQSGQIHPVLQAQLNLRPGQPWILAATSGPGHRISHPHHELVVANLARLSRALPNVPVVVKLHRKDLAAYYQQARKDCAGSRFYVVPHGASGFPDDINDWLQGCSIVLTGASTSAVDAMLMEVPVITMDFCNDLHDVDFIDLGATCHVHSGEELESAVRKLLELGGLPQRTLDRVQAFLNETFYALDGNAAVRGATAVCQLGRLGP
jgi:hypothetical protein